MEFNTSFRRLLLRVFYSFPFLLFILSLLFGLAVYAYLNNLWTIFAVAIVAWIVFFILSIRKYRLFARKIAFMFDAIDNGDTAFKYAMYQKENSSDKLVVQSMNRIIDIISSARREAIEQEKYYELIINKASAGVVVIDERGYVYQTNKEALRLLGLAVFTHIDQLAILSDELKPAFLTALSGQTQQVTYHNERESMTISLKSSEIVLSGRMLHVISVNNINRELEDNELESWVRLTRVLTHEIMNAVTPITSLSETLLSQSDTMNDELREGLEAIRTTGNGLISFVDSYRNFTHIPTPKPSLFYVRSLYDRVLTLSGYRSLYPNITIHLKVEPDNLIVFADEDLVYQVVFNLLKNAVQAIGEKRSGVIELKAYTDEKEAVVLRIGNDGPPIPPEEAAVIFVPFYTTQKQGTGVGLSISRQIMRVSGGTIRLLYDPELQMTVFELVFP